MLPCNGDSMRGLAGQRSRDLHTPIAGFAFVLNVRLDNLLTVN